MFSLHNNADCATYLFDVHRVSLATVYKQTKKQPKLNIYVRVSMLQRYTLTLSTNVPL